MSRLVNTDITTQSASSGGTAYDTQITVRLSYFVLGAYNSGTNSQAITFVTSVSRSYGGLSTGAGGSSFVKFWVNVANPTGISVGINDETQTSGNPTYNQGSEGTYTYTFPGSITRVAMFISGFTRTDTNSTVANAYSGNMTIYNSTADFNFIDASSTLSKIIRLPPITFADMGKLYFYKITGTLTRNAYILTGDGSLINDHNIAGVVITNTHGCLILISNGTNWYIANYYPSSLQLSLPTTSSSVSIANRIANSTINKVGTQKFLFEATTGTSTSKDSVSFFAVWFSYSISQFHSVLKYSSHVFVFEVNTLGFQEVKV
jgi:hypothetical protein